VTEAMQAISAISITTISKILDKQLKYKWIYLRFGKKSHANDFYNDIGWARYSLKVVRIFDFSLKLILIHNIF
jgi:hypothetical protein